jgi:hypothetical protein
MKAEIKNILKCIEKNKLDDLSWEKCVENITKQMVKGNVHCKDLMLPTILCALGIESDHPDKKENLSLFLKEIETADKALDFLLNYAQYTKRDYEWIVDFFTNNSYGLAGVEELNKIYSKFIEKLHKEKETDWILWSLICLINYDDELLPVYIEENESIKDALQRYAKEEGFPAPLTFINQLLTLKEIPFGSNPKA